MSRMKEVKTEKEKAKLSIVVPIYNGEEYIEAKIRSLTGITNVDLEIIFVVNKSDDRSHELTDLLCKTMNNISVIHQTEHLNSTQNFEDGVRRATGSHIFVSAVDDIVNKNFYRNALDLLKQYPTACAVAPVTRFINGNHGNERISFNLIGSLEDRLRVLIDNIRVSHGIFYSLMPREITHKLYSNFVDEFDFVGGDWLFALKLASMGEIYRTENHECIFGTRGTSRSKQALWRKNDIWFKKIFPYRHLVTKVLGLTKQQKISVKFLLYSFCFRLIRGGIHRYMYHVKDILLNSTKRVHN